MWRSMRSIPGRTIPPSHDYAVHAKKRSDRDGAGQGASLLACRVIPPKSGAHGVTRPTTLRTVIKDKI